MNNRAARYRARAVIVAVVIAALAVVCADASAGTWPVPTADHSSWFSYEKNLKDPTATYTQKVSCSSFTPSGEATLYPYNVPQGSTLAYQWAYRNNSSKGVTVTSNSTSTDDMNDGGLAFFVTSLHVSGDYAFRVSIQCQSNDPDALGTAGTPSATNIASTSATINATLNSSAGATEPFEYYVQYGTQPAVYTSQTPAVTVNLPKGSTTAESIPMTGLTAGTVYHYRVVVVTQEPGFVGATSYSGADRQFDTGSGLGSASPQRRLETISPGATAGLRLTAPSRPGGPVSLRAPAGNALQYWTAGNGPIGSRTTLVNARTGLCLDISGGSLKTGAAAVTNRCRAGARSQLWRLVRTSAARWRIVNLRSGKALSALTSAHRVVQSNSPAGAHTSWTTRSVRAR